MRTTSNRLSRYVTHGLVGLREEIYYVATFGEYNMNAIRRAVRLESDSPAGQAGRGLPRSGKFV